MITVTIGGGRRSKCSLLGGFHHYSAHDIMKDLPLAGIELGFTVGSDSRNLAQQGFFNASIAVLCDDRAEADC